MQGAELIVWTGPGRCELIGRLLDVMGAAVTPIGVGGPRSQPVSELAEQLHCGCEDDLRKLIVEHPAAFLLLGDHEDVSVDDLHAAADAGAAILTLEPIVDDFDMLEQIEPLAGSLHLLPAFTQSPGAQASANPSEALGGQRVVGFDSIGQEASLYARLWDAWATALAYLGQPQSIDAALIGSPPPQRPAQLSGRLTAHGRTPDAGSVVLTLADAGGRSARSLHVISDEMELCSSDGEYELRKIDGSVLDAEKSKEPTSWVDLIAHQWRRLIDRSEPGGEAARRNSRLDRQVLACCLATLLSTRTGEPESPADLLRMHV